MPWTFDNSRLTSPSGTSWPARSGSRRHAMLPEGDYAIGTAVPVDEALAENRPFTDAGDFAWFCPLAPRFNTCRGTRGGRLGIHPDGNLPGTEGCIGVTCADTRGLYETLRCTADRVLTVSATGAA